MQQNHLVYSPVPSNTFTWMDQLTSIFFNTLFVKSLGIQDPPADLQLIDPTSTPDPTAKPQPLTGPDHPTKPGAEEPTEAGESGES